MESIDKIKPIFGKKAESATPTNVSIAVIRRLPRYHRHLGELMRQNRLRISSAELSKLMNVTASQIRQDLNCFGGFGQQGYGYNVKYLYNRISDLLGVNEEYTVVIVGAGNLGRALAASHMFDRRGVRKVAMFDVSPELVGREVCGLPCHHVSELSEFCRANKISIGVLTTPRDAAEEVAAALAAGGVRGIWNFSNMELAAPSDSVTIQNMHMGDSLLMLCYDLKNLDSTEKDGKDEI